MHKNTIRNAAAATVFICLTALAGCSDDGDSSGMPMANHSASATGSSTAGSAPASAGAHNSQDVMFAQMMIPHHQQAIEMSDLILSKDGIDSRVTELAEQIKAAQTPEITAMRGWLTGWGADPSPSAMDPGGMGHGDMGDGMMSQADMDKLKNADGDQAAGLFLTGMIAHHEGAIVMARTEKADGQNAEAVSLADNIITSQQAEIDTMTKLLADL